MFWYPENLSLTRGGKGSGEKGPPDMAIAELVLNGSQGLAKYLTTIFVYIIYPQIFASIDWSIGTWHV